MSLARIQGALAAVFAAIDDITAAVGESERSTLKARITSVTCTLGEFSVFRVHIGLADPYSHDLTALAKLSDVSLQDGYRVRRACVLDGHTVELMLL